MRNLYIDFDGVILDTIGVTYKILKDMGVDTKDQAKAGKFYQNLNWRHILKVSPEIGNSIECINKIVKSGLFNVFILTHVNSLDEAEDKINYIRNYIADVTVISLPRTISKTKVVRASDSILIDDYSGNLREWEKEGGIGIRFNIELESNGFQVINRLDKVIEMFENKN